MEAGTGQWPTPLRTDVKTFTFLVRNVVPFYYEAACSFRVTYSKMNL
jgi:hypothetical protein